MSKKHSNDTGEPLPVKPVSCCRVEAIINIDERGQMVLPKGLRNKAGIRAGDKIVVTSWEKDGKICCITLTKAALLTETVKRSLGHVIKDIL